MVYWIDLLEFDVQNEILYDEDEEDLFGLNENRDKKEATATAAATSTTTTATTTTTTTESLRSNIKVFENISSERLANPRLIGVSI